MVNNIHRFAEIKRIIKNVIKKGFLQILIGNTLVKFITFFSLLLVPRILSKSDFGTLAYVDNIMSYVLLANGLGLANAVLRYCSMSDDPAERAGYLRFSYIVGFACDIALLFILFCSFHIIPFGIKDAGFYLGLLIMIPLFSFTFDCIQLFFRGGLHTKLFSTFSVVFAAVAATMDVTFALLGGIKGMIFGRYLGYAITVLVGLYLLSRLQFWKTAPKMPQGKVRKEMVKYGVLAMLGNFTSLMMPLNEAFIVNNVLQNKLLTADYRAASLLPQQIQFVVMSIMVFVFPYFAKKHLDGKWIRSKFLQLTLYVIAGMVVCIGLAVLLSPQIISIVFGQKYKEILPIMRVLWVAFGINACIRMIAGNILAAIGDVRFNFINTFGFSLLHIFIDYYLVTHYGISGAAYGILIVYTLSGATSIAYLLHKCKRLEKMQSVGNVGW